MSEKNPVRAAAGRLGMAKRHGNKEAERRALHDLAVLRAERHRRQRAEALLAAADAEDASDKEPVS